MYIFPNLGRERKGREGKNGKERKGKGRNGKRRKGMERKKWKGKGRKGMEREGKERKGRKGKERNGKRRKGKKGNRLKSNKVSFKMNISGSVIGLTFSSLLKLSPMFLAREAGTPPRHVRAWLASDRRGFCPAIVANGKIFRKY